MYTNTEKKYKQMYFVIYRQNLYSVHIWWTVAY